MQLEAARALDPLSPVISLNLGRHYYYTRDFDRAIEHFRRTLSLDNHFFIAGQLLAVAHLEKGEHDLAREQLRATPAPPGPFLGLLQLCPGRHRGPPGVAASAGGTEGAGRAALHPGLRPGYCVRQSRDERRRL